MQIDPSLEQANRLVLRDLEHRDIEPMAQLSNDRKVLDRMLYKPDPFTNESAQSFILRAKASNPLERRIFAIIRKEDDQFIGTCGLIICQGHIIPTMDYWIGSDYWGNGYATEAVGLLIKNALPEFRFAMLRASCEPCNIASQRVLEKNGFRAQETAPILVNGSDKQVVVKWYQLNLMPYHGVNEANQQTRDKALFV